jgi:hypothetical protein
LADGGGRPDGIEEVTLLQILASQLVENYHDVQKENPFTLEKVRADSKRTAAETNLQNQGIQAGIGLLTAGNVHPRQRRRSRLPGDPLGGVGLVTLLGNSGTPVR